MMVKIKTKIALNAGIRFVKNDLLKWLSLLFNTYLLAPPNYINIRLTRRCNLRCLQCESWRIKSAPELSTSQWKKIILDIKGYIGPYFLRFYGGEPFCRRDFLELISFCSHNEIVTFITTNATLINHSIACELAKNNVALINISLDGYKSETHDRLRGVQGTYQKVMQAIEYLEGKVPVQINTTIMQDNLDEILDLTEFASRNKLRISFQGYNPEIYRRYDDKNDKNEDSTRISDSQKGDNLVPQDLEKIDYVIDELYRRKQNNKAILNSYTSLKRLKLYYHQSPRLKKRHCEAIGGQLMIKDLGDIVLCSFCSFPVGSIGNISKDSLKDIWQSKEAHGKKKKMLRCQETNCLVIRGCYQESCLEKIAKVKRYIL